MYGLLPKLDKFEIYMGVWTMLQWILSYKAQGSSLGNSHLETWDYPFPQGECPLKFASHSLKKWEVYLVSGQLKNYLMLGERLFSSMLL